MIVLYALSAFDSLQSGAKLLHAFAIHLGYTNGVLLQDSVRWKRDTDRYEKHTIFD